MQRRPPSSTRTYTSMPYTTLFRSHSSRRDAAVVGHHYDVGNDFYELVLGPSLTYSCARFSRPGMSLAEAQDSKHDLVCRKLGLQDRTGMRLLDVGRSEEHTSELQSLMRISYAVFCLKKKTKANKKHDDKN